MNWTEEQFNEMRSKLIGQKIVDIRIIQGSINIIVEERQPQTSYGLLAGGQRSCP